MPAVLVVIPRVSQTLLAAVERLPLVRVEERLAAARDQRLRAKGRLLIDAQTCVEPAQQVVDIHEATIGSEKAYERILRADVAFGPQDSYVGALAHHSRISSECFFRGEVAGAVVAGDEQTEGVA